MNAHNKTDETDDNSLNLEISKTKIKAHMDELQELGMALMELSRNQLNKFDLPDVLIDAIIFANKISSNRAIKRQRQYIGKLMRDVDEDYVRSRLAFVLGESAQETKILHDCEAWRDKLLNSDDALNAFIAKFPNCDITELRQLIRIVRKEQELSQNKNYRKLFQFIRREIES